MATVFLSWSGNKSQFYATAWHSWIKDVFEDAQVFLSSKDIEAGANWRREISSQVRRSKVGIVFITVKNMKAPWILFEAGALAIAKRRRLLICLVSGSPDKLPAPLQAFHAVKSDKAGAKKIFETLKAEIGKPKAKFSLVWPKLEKMLQN